MITCLTRAVQRADNCLNRGTYPLPISSQTECYFYRMYLQSTPLQTSFPIVGAHARSTITGFYLPLTLNVLRLAGDCVSSSGGSADLFVAEGFESDA